MIGYEYNGSMSEYESLISEINRKICSERTILGGLLALSDSIQLLQNVHEITPLDIIFDKHELNDYGRVIMQRATFKFVSSNNKWFENFGIHSFANIQEKMLAAKAFIDGCKESYDRSEGEKNCVLGIDDFESR